MYTVKASTSHGGCLRGSKSLLGVNGLLSLLSPSGSYDGLKSMVVCFRLPDRA